MGGATDRPDSPNVLAKWGGVPHGRITRETWNLCRAVRGEASLDG